VEPKNSARNCQKYTHTHTQTDIDVSRVLMGERESESVEKIEGKKKKEQSERNEHLFFGRCASSRFFLQFLSSLFHFSYFQITTGLLLLLAVVRTLLLLVLAWEHDAFELLLEPLDGFCLLDVVVAADCCACTLAL